MARPDPARVATARELRERLAVYLDELQRWNRRLNLTSVPGAALWAHHVDDSLALAELTGLSAGDRVIDIGSGAGVPGLVLAIAHPDAAVTLLEADTRKAGFLTHVAGKLALTAVAVVDRRAEEAAHDSSLRECFGVAVSRAAAPAATLCELALPFVRVGGCLYAQVGDADLDVERCRAAAAVCGGGAPEAVRPGVLRVRKLTPTPSAYPRRAGVPSRRPLR